MSIFDRIWSRLRGKEPDPHYGTTAALIGGAVAVSQADKTDDATDYGWSGDHLSGGGSDVGGGGGFDAGGGGDAGGGV